MSESTEATETIVAAGPTGADADAAAPPSELKDMEAAQAEMLSHPAAQRDLARARARVFEKMAKQPPAPPTPAPDYNWYDGRAHDDKGNVATPKLRSGQPVKVRSNVHGLNDGGYESAEGRVMGNAFLSGIHKNDDGSPATMHPVRLANGEMVAVPERALAKPVVRGRQSLCMSGIRAPLFAGRPYNVLRDRCGGDCRGPRFCSDPEHAAKVAARHETPGSPAPVPAAQPSSAE